MNGRTLIREARRRGGLTQAELAARVHTTQSAIARLEAGTTAPSLERIDAIVRACGLELLVEIDAAVVDPDEWQRTVANLRRTPGERVADVVAAARFLEAGRRAKAGRR
ncbi:MAG TPA: helix-turn-helix transcriptional regulator [Acidimicrobiales bacterium]|nr:helix-turn-helix transcriptional regulator [Acidimicrobiales bacterium]